MVSRIGEGGYTLVRGSTMIVGSGLDDTPDTGIEVIKKAGINVVEFPSVVTSEYSRQQDFVTGIKCNGHIDRVACLLEGKDGKMNLIVNTGVMLKYLETGSDQRNI